MNVCENPVGACTGLMGCGGRLCRNMRHALSPMEVLCFERDEMGEIISEEAEKKRICGFITKLPPPSDPDCAIPGIRGTASNVRLTVVSSEVPLKVGDTVMAGDKIYSVQLQLSDLPVRYSLVERAEDI